MNLDSLTKTILSLILAMLMSNDAMTFMGEGGCTSLTNVCATGLNIDACTLGGHILFLVAGKNNHKYDGLKQQEFILSQSAGQKSNMKVSAGLCSLHRL